MRLITRFADPEPFGPTEITPQQVFALKKATFKPSAIADRTFSNMVIDQYSSCPTESQPLARRNPARSVCVSRLLMYDTSYPSFSIQNASGNSHNKNSPEPCESGASSI